VTEVFSARPREGIVLVGHRGGRGEGWPAENTIAAFARAEALGAPAIELDVRTCASGDVVVMHDVDLTRMTGGSDRRVVARLTLGELARVGMGPAHERVPTLDDVLDWARERVAVNVEAKHDVPSRLALARGIAKTLARHPGVEVLLSSFDPTLLAMLAATTPRVPRAWLTHEGQQRWEPAWGRIATRAPIHAVHLERTQASPPLVSSLRRAGKRVGVWTVNDPSEARDLAALGVDWIITDDPGRTRSRQGPREID
jgi:glycerophosphoryl diester phosphodiesterase